MSRPPRSTSVDDTLDEPLPGSLDGESDASDADATGPVRVAPDLAALPIVGLTRRRVAALIGVLLAVWIVMLFARQVGEAQAATSTAEELAVGNQAQQLKAAGLERELELIGRQRYIEQQARAYGLGSVREIAFTLDPEAPDVPDDAPGSEALRVGAPRDDVSPLERWLTVLFGPTD